ncbi:hypothetical protein [Halobacteriovorax sp.]|uniref:hypothetical protein n=1 Tax=Halobacteriovorax sp. TaxID=2020862 RepID=UPI003AF21B78
MYSTNTVSTTISGINKDCADKNDIEIIIVAIVTLEVIIFSSFERYLSNNIEIPSKLYDVNITDNVTSPDRIIKAKDITLIEFLTFPLIYKKRSKRTQNGIKNTCTELIVELISNKTKYWNRNKFNNDIFFVNESIKKADTTKVRLLITMSFLKIKRANKFKIANNKNFTFSIFKIAKNAPVKITKGKIVAEENANTERGRLITLSKKLSSRTSTAAINVPTIVGRPNLKDILKYGNGVSTV